LARHDEAVGLTFYDLDNGQWNIPALRQLLEEVIPQRRTIEGYPVPCRSTKVRARERREIKPLVDAKLLGDVGLSEADSRSALDEAALIGGRHIFGRSGNGKARVALARKLSGLA
jgi:hypothetical protein